MLKDNVIPILFDHNKDKQPVKRKGTLLRNEIAQKKQLNSMISFSNLNTKLIAKRSTRSQRPEISRHKQTFTKKNLFSVISKRISRKIY